MYSFILAATFCLPQQPEVCERVTWRATASYRTYCSTVREKAVAYALGFTGTGALVSDDPLGCMRVEE
jgi:hypothetical protein